MDVGVFTPPHLSLSAEKSAAHRATQASPMEARRPLTLIKNTPSSMSAGWFSLFKREFGLFNLAIKYTHTHTHALRHTVNNHPSLH